jgi:hypothetical protein
MIAPCLSATRCAPKRGSGVLVSAAGLPRRAAGLVVVHDDVGVIGRAGRGEVELLGGNVAGAEAPLDFGGGSESRQVPDPGAVQYLLERGGHQDAQVPSVDQQWRAIAERAPDDATADYYLHQVFEPTARAIDGLEKALAGLGLLDQALVLDLRRPQDYFHRIWSTAFRASDLTADDPVPAGLPGETA